MSYFDRFYAAYFKETEEGKAFFPFSNFGSGYLLENEEVEADAREYVKRNQLALIFFIFLSFSLEQRFFLLLVIPAWWYVGKSFIEKHNLQPVKTRLRFLEIEHNSSKTMGPKSMWTMVVVGVLSIALSLGASSIMLSVFPETVPVSIWVAASLSGMIGVAVGAYCLWKARSIYNHLQASQ